MLGYESETCIRRFYDCQSNSLFPTVRTHILGLMCSTCIYSIYLSEDLDIGLLLTRKLLNQGFLVVELKSPLGKNVFA